jgi:alpha-2-macroglobulin
LGVQDLAFTWSRWQKGIEPWRFNLPTDMEPTPSERAHTVLDRMLLRAGETVSMKHYMRNETSKGFGLPKALPPTLVITHQGTGQNFEQPLSWRSTATGGRSAENTWAVPPGAKLGVYEISLRNKEGGRSYGSGEFRVEEFRLPVFEGRVHPSDKAALVQAKTVPLDVQINYVSGGPAANLAVQISALLRNRRLGLKTTIPLALSRRAPPML